MIAARLGDVTYTAADPLAEVFQMIPAYQAAVDALDRGQVWTGDTKRFREVARASEGVQAGRDALALRAELDARNAAFRGALSAQRAADAYVSRESAGLEAEPTAPSSSPAVLVAAAAVAALGAWYLLRR